MKTPWRVLTLVAALSWPLLSGWISAALASDDDQYRTADVVRGGLLYDHWPKLNGFKAVESHPLYPATGKQAGTSTWRCKECHGWDYRGADGRYRSGSHHTGIGGVWEARTAGPKALYRALTDAAGSHDFAGHLGGDDLWALVRFLREGQVDATAVFRSDGSVSGRAESGKALYGTHCSRCHGADGNARDFEDEEAGVQGVGWIARKNPQETLHKIRWGHPGSKMPSLVAEVGGDDQAPVDLLAYTQTLP